MSASSITVLVTSAGRRVELLNCFREDARRLGCDLRLVAADLNPALSAACQSADLAVGVPRCTDPAYGTALLKICRDRGVALVVPTIDTELLALAMLAPALARQGTRAVVSSPGVVALARDKFATARLLGGAGVPVPRTTTLSALRADPGSMLFPLIVKPADGSNSQGLHRLRGDADLQALAVSSEGYLAQEWVQGREFTVNIFMDREGRLRCAVPHERLEVRGGEVSKGRTTRLPGLGVLLPAIERVLGAGYGPLCFQGILTPAGELVVFEINARFGGGFPVSHRSGARFTQWLLEEALGLPVTANDSWEDGVTMLRYDAAVFVGKEAG